MKHVSCTLVATTQLTPTVTKIRLRPQQPVHFQPGQYLQLVLSETDKRPFSIANINNSDELELHIGAGEQDSYAMGAITHLKTHQQVDVILPQGNAYLRRHDRPVILLAGGTGFSYVQSLLMGLMQQPRHEPVFVYWGVRKSDDLYALPQLQAWQAQHSWLEIIPVVEFADPDWQGRTGRVLDAVLHDFISLEPYTLYMAGRFDMVGAARDLFLSKGLLSDHMYADAFEFLK